jgi:complex III assembly factor LYRM7
VLKPLFAKMAATAVTAEGLAAYRAVLRAARRTFAGDSLMLQESAVEIRRRFEDNRGLAPGSDEATRALADAREAAHFITHMIVQAQRAPSGSFGTNPVTLNYSFACDLGISVGPIKFSGCQPINDYTGKLARVCGLAGDYAVASRESCLLD